MRIITVLCSNRPTALEKMLFSFINTAVHEIYINVDKGDLSTIAVIKRFDKLAHIRFKEHEGLTVTQMLNDSYLVLKEERFNYWHLSNDDVEYQTKNWELELIKPIERKSFGLSWGYDGEYDKGKIPTFPMITRDLVFKMGWLQFPKVEKYFGDIIWQKVAEHYKCLYYCPSVKLNHNQQYKNQNEFCDEKNPVYQRDLMVLKSLRRLIV